MQCNTSNDDLYCVRDSGPSLFTCSFFLLFFFFSKISQGTVKVTSLKFGILCNDDFYCVKDNEFFVNLFVHLFFHFSFSP